MGHELGEASSVLALVSHARGRWRDLFRAEFVHSVRETPELAMFVFDAHLGFAEFSLHGPHAHEEVAPFAEELLAVAEEAGSVQGQGLATLMLGEVELLSGRVESAERALARAVSLHEAAGSVSGQSLSLERLAEAAIALGRRWKAGRLLARAKDLAEMSALVSHLLVRVLEAADVFARARRPLDEARCRAAASGAV